MIAWALYLVPQMIGTRNIAFPRLNAYGYWVYLFGGGFLYLMFFLNTGADAGWFSYVPLAGPQFSPGKRVDVWAQTITFTEIAALVGAVELIVTIFKQRAPGMSMNRMPLYVWSILVTAFMVLFAMPFVAMASMFLAMDRLVGTQFFNPAEGGDALLWQHLFWFFGHPEVYIIFIPGLGFVSSIVATFARRPVFGYTPMVLSLIATGFVGFGLWVHHMFAAPIPQLGGSFFTAASTLIAIPSGVQIFCWIATLWLGKPRFQTPLLYVLGFFFIFVIGGLTGVMLASVPFDLQAHDTYFVVAHFHYVLIGGAVFPLLGAITYWFPKVTGRMMSERLGKLGFWLVFAGVNVTFFPMHFVGLMGMTRRVYTYLPSTGWGPLNLLSTVGAFIIALGVLVFVGNVLASWRAGAASGEDPWGADTLEWSIPSPPPPYNYRHIPIVQGRSALWARTPDRPVVTGMDDSRREVLVTTVMDAEPDNRYEHPGPDVTPFLSGLATAGFLITLVFTFKWVWLWVPALFVALACWAWPEKRPHWWTARARRPA
jgi:cytochrome c oxidase subunit 1